ncbi:TAXI family TRAP transporter solute-binding subunit [Lipingzhangella halophila]|nr:TAXI family TRAP transporter solute-binding subunit [Lipingzhangella halophila]
MKKRVLATSIAVVSTMSLAACGNAGEDEEGMPNQMVWSTYGTGTSTYADVAAVADAITADGGPNIRVITSDTAVGRVTPVSEGQADMARTGDEYIYAFEGDHDFATGEWGPQDVRVVWGPIAPHGLLVRDDSGIESFEDLEGADFPRITANPSVNNKLEAFLAYGGLTWDDVNEVELGYGEQPNALENGEIDVLFHQIYGPDLYELENSFDIRWLSMDDDSEEKVEAVTDIAPGVEIGEFGGGPGQEEGETAQSLVYPLPFMTYADTDETLVYETVKAINDTYDDYKDSTANTEQWNVENSDTEPKTVPFHPGTVRYLEENDAWDEEKEARNNELIERGESLRSGWEDFVAEADTDGGDVQEEWTAYKEENVPEE